MTNIFKTSKGQIDQRLWVSLGNFFEYFDLYLLTHLSHILSKKFLVGFSSDWLRAIGILNMSLLVPLAAIFWGVLGDKFGRKPVIIHSASIVLACACILCILPTADTFEYAAFLFLVVRGIQGIAMAGEPIAAKLYAIEDAIENENKKIPFWIQMMSTGQDLGGLLAMALAFGLVHYNVSEMSLFGIDWIKGWRIPFIIGAIFALFVFFLRRKLNETREYDLRFLNHPRINMTHFVDKRNMICFYFISLLQPVYFVYLITYYVPQMVVDFNWPEHYVPLVNFCIITASMLTNIIITAIVVTLELDRKKCQYFLYSISMGCLIYLYNLDISTTDDLVLKCALIVGIFSGGTWNINYGHLIKTLALSQRFKNISWMWGAARITSWIFSITLLPFLQKHFGLDGLHYLCIGLLCVASIAMYIHVPYDKIGDFFLHKKLKERDL